MDPKKPILFLVLLAVSVVQFAGCSPSTVQEKAEQGDARAQWSLGVMYAHGQGVAKDEAEAVNWYRKAAEQGNADAQWFLVIRYASGRGVPKDEAEAVNWLRKAAEQGGASAQFQLGVRHANGEGVAKDETAAYMWYLLAGAKGNEIARKNIPIIEKTLTSEQRAEGQRMAKDWKPKKARGK
jgi:TPR repeat protein